MNTSTNVCLCFVLVLFVWLVGLVAFLEILISSTLILRFIKLALSSLSRVSDTNTVELR